MEEYIKELQDKVGLTAEQAKKAIEAIVGKVKSKIPESLHGSIDSIFSQQTQDKVNQFSQQAEAYAAQASDTLKTYADQNSQFELKVATEKAQAAITNVEGMIKALDRIQTESRHEVSTNADAARSEIMSLNGANTSSTHTIYVRKVEANATGGLVGGGVRRYADGGAVAPACAGSFMVTSILAFRAEQRIRRALRFLKSQHPDRGYPDDLQFDALLY